MMNVGYLDTNILVAYFGGDEVVKRTLERFAGIKLPAAAYIEFMTGLETRREEEAFDKIIHIMFDVVHTDIDICREAAILRRERRLKLPDAMIYATARVGGGTLITRDKDFDGGAGDVYVPD
jgi:hypothetical protein